MRVLLVGGRSGGHIYALVAVASVLQARAPETDLLFVGEAGRMEEDFVPRAGYRLRTLAMPAATGTAARLLALPQWYRLYRQALAILREFKPDVVIGSGGQVCLPVFLAAHRARVPSVLLEANAIPGWSVRLACRWARPQVVGLLFPGAAHRLPAGQRVEAVGYPLRPEILDTTRAEGVRALELDPARRTLLVFGGSQGSAHLNDVLIDWLRRASAAPPAWVDDWQIVHLGGWVNAPSAEPDLQAPLPYHYLPYLHEMHYALAAADLVVGRAGATSLAELTALGLPAVVVPLEGLADNHQVHNATWVGEAGAARVIPDARFTVDGLAAVLDELCGGPARLQALADVSASLGRPDSAERVADLAQALVGGGR